MRYRQVQLLAGKGADKARFTAALRGIAVDRRNFVMRRAIREIKVLTHRLFPWALKHSQAGPLGGCFRREGFCRPGRTVEIFDTEANIRPHCAMRSAWGW